MGWLLNYKMAELKAIINQVQEIQVILHETHAKGMTLSGAFQVDVIIEKLLMHEMILKTTLNTSEKR